MMERNYLVISCFISLLIFSSTSVFNSIFSMVYKSSYSIHIPYFIIFSRFNCFSKLCFLLFSILFHFTLYCTYVLHVCVSRWRLRCTVRAVYVLCTDISNSHRVFSAVLLIFFEIQYFPCFFNLPSPSIIFFIFLLFSINFVR